MVAAPAHRDHVFDQLRGRGEGRVLFQPENRGTAVGVFLGLTYVLARDPEATVVIYPSDHFIYPESAFLNVVRTAVRHAERYADEPVLLGVRPSSPEVDYGWIVPSPAEGDLPTRRVEAFLEKPPRRTGGESAAEGGPLEHDDPRRQGGFASGRSAGGAFRRSCGSFARFGESLRARSRRRPARRTSTRTFPRAIFPPTFSRRAPDRLRVLEMSGVWWNDWGRPERILATLRALERSDEFPKALVLEPEETLVHAASPRRQEVSHVP